MLLSEILSPTTPSEDLQVKRNAGRFGFQICADTIAFTQNVPQRILMVDRLGELPSIIYSLLQEEKVKRILEEEFDSVSTREKSQRHAPGDQASRTWSAVRNQITDASQKDIQDYVLHSGAILCELAQLAWHEASPSAIVPSVSHEELRKQASNLPQNWFSLLEILLPHIEQKIWLTDMSAPLPAHAVTRMHDPWSLFILFWCFSEFQRYKKSETGVFAANSDTLSGAFYTDIYKIAVIRAGSLRRKNGSELQNISIIIGPIFSEPDPIERVHRNPYAAMAKYFGAYLRLASELVADWTHVNDAVPTIEELMDAYESRHAIEPTEFTIRAKSIQDAWRCLGGVNVPDQIALNRTDWECCALLCVWAGRWGSNLKEYAKVANDSTPWQLCLPDWNEQVRTDANGRLHKHLRVDVDVQNDQLHLSLIVGNAATTIDTRLAEVKRTNPHLDLPGVTWNRFRERQAASWSAQIGAVSNLMQRMTTKMETHSEAISEAWESPDLLMGFGARLCRHVATLTHAHSVVLYWKDYAQTPARLRVLESYAKTYEQRAGRKAVHREFDAEVYQPEQPECAAYARAESQSMVYRCAAENRYQLPEDENGKLDTQKVILTGYTEDNPAPLSKMAIPVRVHGRVIGVMELLGAVKGQLTPQLRAPLRRICGVVGPTMYQALLLKQLSEINRWVVALPAGTIEKKHQNPLKNLSEKLCNVFLCPMVHIWLIDDNKTWFDLLGSNSPKIFKFGNQNIDYPRAPNFQVMTGAKDKSSDSSRPFAELALRLWGCYQSSDSETWGQVPKAFYDAEGLMVKAIYRPSSGKTDYYSGNEKPAMSAEPQVVWNSLVEATGKGILLGNDFVEDQARSYRKWLFQDQRLAEVAAFAVVQDVMKTATEMPLDADHAANSAHADDRKRAIVGVITLHDFGDSYLQNFDAHKTRVNDTQPSKAQQISSYGSGWMPVVAHMQNHLPSVFQQIRLLTDPYNAMRNTFIHEAQHEIDTTAGVVSKLEKQLHFALKGRGHEALHDLLRAAGQPTALFPSLKRDALSDLLERARALLNALQATANSADYIGLESQRQRLNRLHGRLAGGRDFMELRLPGDEAGAVFPLRGLLREQVLAFSGKNAAKQRVEQWTSVTSPHIPSGGTKPANWPVVSVPWTDANDPEIFVVESIWRHVVQNLLSNMDKYTPVGMPWTFMLEPYERRVSFINSGRYDPTRDTTARHLAHGGRGVLTEAVGGSGVGLPIAERSAKLLGIQLDYSIHPTDTPGFATYKITLDLQQVWHTEFTTKDRK